MKTTKFLSAIVIILSLALFSACSQNDLTPMDEETLPLNASVNPSTSILKSTSRDATIESILSPAEKFVYQLEKDFGPGLCSLVGGNTGLVNGRAELVHKLDPIPVTPIGPIQPKPQPDPNPDPIHDDAYWDAYFINHFNDYYEQGKDLIESLKNSNIPDGLRDTLTQFRPHEYVHFYMLCEQYDILTNVQDDDKIDSWFNEFVISEGLEVYVEALGISSDSTYYAGGPMRAKPTNVYEKIGYCLVSAVGLKPVLDIFYEDSSAWNTFKSAGFTAAVGYIVGKYGVSYILEQLARFVSSKFVGPVALVVVTYNFADCMGS